MQTDLLAYLIRSLHQLRRVHTINCHPTYQVLKQWGHLNWQLFVMTASVCFTFTMICDGSSLRFRSRNYKIQLAQDLTGSAQIPAQILIPLPLHLFQSSSTLEASKILRIWIKAPSARNHYSSFYFSMFYSKPLFLLSKSSNTGTTFWNAKFYIKAKHHQ